MSFADSGISKSLGSTASTVSILRKQLILVTLFSLVFSFISAYFISKRFSQPVAVLSKKAAHISDRSFTVKTDKFYCNELDELSETLDRTKDELLKAEDYRKDFFANISHDLRTPLTMIKGYAEMISDFSDPENTVLINDANVIIKESDRLTSLVNDLIDYSSLEHKLKNVDFEINDISLITSSTIEQFNSLCIAKNITILTDIMPSQKVLCDKKSIERVIYNLIDNALTHTDDKISISVFDNSDSVRVEIRDFGKGIPVEDLENIWERYFTRNQQKRSKVGSGLGLAISKEILSAHNALYGAVNNADCGSIFFFELKKR